jgi:hypothetical protein
MRRTEEISTQQEMQAPVVRSARRYRNTDVWRKERVEPEEPKLQLWEGEMQESASQTMAQGMMGNGAEPVKTEPGKNISGSCVCKVQVQTVQYTDWGASIQTPLNQEAERRMIIGEQVVKREPT